MGALTLALLGRGARVTGVEIDPLLARQLPTTVAQHCHSEIHRLTVLNLDILALRPHHLMEPPTTAVLNVPNAIAATAMLYLLAEFPSIHTVLTVMDSTDAALRLTAEPGEQKCSADGAKLRFFGTVRRHGTVASTAWWPTAGTQQGLVRVNRYQRPLVSEDPEFRDAIFELIDIAFKHRRHTSRTAFAEWAGSGNESARRLLAASIDPARPPYDLGIAEFVRLKQRSDASDEIRTVRRPSVVA